MGLAGPLLTPSSCPQIATAGGRERATGGGNEADTDGAAAALGSPRKEATTARKALATFRLQPTPLAETLRAINAPPARDEATVVRPTPARTRTDTAPPVALVPFPAPPVGPRGPRNMAPYGRAVPARGAPPKRARAVAIVAMAHATSALEMAAARGPTRATRGPLRAARKGSALVARASSETDPTPS